MYIKALEGAIFFVKSKFHLKREENEWAFSAPLFIFDLISGSLVRSSSQPRRPRAERAPRSRDSEPGRGSVGGILLVARALFFLGFTGWGVSSHGLHRVISFSVVL